MDTQSPRIRLDLTDDQRQQIKILSGKEVRSLDLTIEELEGRIVPESVSFNFAQIKN